MELRRRNQSGDRRRRVLRDDNSGKTPSNPRESRGRSGSSGRRYTDAALAEVQPRITQFIPLRPLAVFHVVMWGLISVALPQFLYVVRETYLSRLGNLSFPALALTGPGTLAAWVSSVTLLLASAFALLIFNIRRHKLD
ncbi:MAG: hypothetical protein KDA60_17840, partial [Planctomycetales bacterium]|nr:hypothetical protein [Planctomycetales bacterium]